MVIDTSALLALWFNEKHGPWVLDRLTESSGQILMSTVNLTEALIRFKDLQPNHTEHFEEELRLSKIEFIPPTITHAKIAAEARLSYPLNLGDCFAYALAKEKKVSLLAIDKDFLATDIVCVLP